MNVKGVVFDMDGLMFDTENLTYKLQCGVLDAMGLSGLSLDEYKLTVGKRTADLESFFKDRFGDGFDCAAFRVKCREAYIGYTDRHGVPIKDGLFGLLRHLKALGIKTAVCTSTTFRSAERTLRIAGALPYFDELVCAEDVKNGKPHPEPFRKSAEKLGLEPAECVALEDSINGIKSAFAAGLIPIMVPDLIPPTDEIKPMCRAVCASLSDVISLIE